MKKLFAIWSLLVACVTASPALASAATITGTVAAHDGKPLAGAKISVKTFDGEVAGTATTGTTGAFHFSVPSGKLVFAVKLNDCIISYTYKLTASQTLTLAVTMYRTCSKSTIEVR